MFNYILLPQLVSAFAPNPGTQTMMNYKNTPSPDSLINTVKQMEATVIDADELLARTADLASMLPYWDLTDDIVEGYEAIKNGREKYLPKFVDEEAKDYDLRLKLTKFTNIYRDIVEGLASKSFEEEVQIKGDNIPTEIKDLVEDIDGYGNNLTNFASQVMFNGINSAFDLIFIDYPEKDDSIVTIADQKKAGLRPFFSRILARNVLEIRNKIVKNRIVISYIRIYEPGNNNEPNRVRIIENNDSGQILWKLYAELENKTNKRQFQLEKEGTITIDVIPIVPFITGRKNGNTWKVFPAMQDAADLQIDLYQQESGLKFIKQIAAYPMLAANGIRPDLDAKGNPKPIRRGPLAVLYSTPNANGQSGSWAFVEPTAENMKFLQEGIDSTKQDLRELGRQPLTATSGNLTVITTAVAANKARSVVSSWALTLKDALENALVIACKFMGIDKYEPEVNVYNEFDDFTDGGKDLDAITKARENGDISQETYWDELKRRKVLSPEFDSEKEKEKLLNEIPDMDAQDDLSGNPSPDVPMPTPAKQMEPNNPAKQMGVPKNASNAS